MSADSMSALFRDAIATVEAECVEAHRLMCDALVARRVAIDVDGEAFDIELGATPTVVPALIHVRTTARVLHEVVQGIREPLSTILEDAIHIRGAPEDLIALGEAGLAFVKGAARCNSAEPLLARLEELANRAGGMN